MVVGISNATASVSTLPLSVRAESAAAILSNSSASSEVASPALDAADVLKNFRYNSFEFVYKQDFGKIVLLRQEPSTGNDIEQFPSEYYLRQYAATARAQRSAELISHRAEANTPAPGDGLEPIAHADSAVTTPAAATVAASPSPAPAPAARVDIKV